MFIIPFFLVASRITFGIIDMFDLPMFSDLCVCRLQQWGLFCPFVKSNLLSHNNLGCLGISIVPFRPTTQLNETQSEYWIFCLGHEMVSWGSSQSLFIEFIKIAF